MNFADLIDDLGPLDTRQARALAALTVQREITRAVTRMWALYEVAGPDGVADTDNQNTMNEEQPEGANDAFAASLDEWWHACIGAEEAWSKAAGVPYAPSQARSDDARALLASLRRDLLEGYGPELVEADPADSYPASVMAKARALAALAR